MEKSARIEARLRATMNTAYVHDDFPALALLSIDFASASDSHFPPVQSAMEGSAE